MTRKAGDPTWADVRELAAMCLRIMAVFALGLGGMFWALQP